MELASPAHPADAPRHPASAGAAGAHTAYFGPPDTHSSSTASSNSAGSLSMAMMGIGSRNSPSTFATPPYASPGHHSNKHPQMAYYSGQQQQQQQQQQSHQPLQALHQQHQQYAQRYAARPAPPALGTGVLTPDSIASMGTRSFPMTVDEMQTSRRRSQSTDSMQTTVFGGAGASALPQVLGNANIRNRSMTATQRQRTSDTPLFPILLHRIINDPQNESWIRWCDNGRAFKFSSADNLLACLQAAGLRAQNYHSIEKNLNDYRFTRLTDQRRKIPDHDGKLWWMFSHPQFLRDSPDGIVNIQRRRRTNPASLAALAPQPSAIPTPAHPPMLHQQHQQQQGYPAHPPGPHSGADGWM
ncbi:Heat shock transcription factor [Coemansia spiralis]|nr:Heat shock transcription factor [Coemansia spiralis]